MQMLMMEFANRNLRAYFVWTSILSADNETAARQCTQRFSAPNSVYFWTPSQKLAQEAASAMRMATGRVAWDVYLLFSRGITWDRSFPAPTYWQRQLDILQGDVFNPQTMSVRVQEALK